LGNNQASEVKVRRPPKADTFSATPRMSPGRLLYLTRRRLKLGLIHGWAERFIEPRIDGWQMATGLPMAPVPVHLLTSKPDWRMALWMLTSLHKTSCLRWPVVLHEDGSLGTEQLDVFSRMFPGLRVIRRSEADAKMAGVLARLPRCADYRKRMPHGLKCFDIPQLAESPRFLMLDPDVIFFARPSEILNWIADSEDQSCWFNEDFQEPSPIPPLQAESELGVKLWPMVNTGLCLVSRESVTALDAMESWLGHPAMQDPKVQWRVEQTLLALAASKAGNGGLLPASYEVSSRKRRKRGCIARHYVGCVRARFMSEGIMDLRNMVFNF